MIYRVDRGGSWITYSRCIRSTIRYRNDPYFRGNYRGFRIAEDVGSDRYRVYRGGCWRNPHEKLCSANRGNGSFPPDFRSRCRGFRVVEDLK